MAEIAVGNALLCEYVAEGNNGKHVLVNVFAGSVVLGEVPMDMSFGLYVEVLDPVAEFDVDVLVDGSSILKGRARVESWTSSDVHSVFVLPLARTTVAPPGTIDVYLTAAGYERTRALSKKLVLADPAA